LYDDDNALSFMVFNATSRFQLYRGCLIIHVAGRLNTLNIHLGTDHLTCRLWFFVSFRIFFRTTRELEHLFFLSRQARNCFPDFNISLYDKNSESDFSSTKIRIFFSATLGIRIFFLETPPWKLNGPSLIYFLFCYNSVFKIVFDKTRVRTPLSSLYKHGRLACYGLTNKVITYLLTI
jgi:hypothetical protein